MKKKNTGCRIVELICYSSLINFGIEFLVHKLNYLIKNVSLIQYIDFVPIYPSQIIERDEIVQVCDRHWDETVTLTKHVTKYKYMRKWMVEFFSKSRVLSLKLLELTQFAWPNLSIYFNFLCAVPRDDVIESTRFLMRPPVIIPPWCYREFIPGNPRKKKFCTY